MWKKKSTIGGRSLKTIAFVFLIPDVRFLYNWGWRDRKQECLPPRHATTPMHEIRENSSREKNLFKQNILDEPIGGQERFQAIGGSLPKKEEEKRERLTQNGGEHSLFYFQLCSFQQCQVFHEQPPLTACSLTGCWHHWPLDHPAMRLHTGHPHWHLPHHCCPGHLQAPEVATAIGGESKWRYRLWEPIPGPSTLPAVMIDCSGTEYCWLLLAVGSPWGPRRQIPQWNKVYITFSKSFE